MSVSKLIPLPISMTSLPLRDFGVCSFTGLRVGYLASRLEGLGDLDVASHGNKHCHGNAFVCV